MADAQDAYRVLGRTKRGFTTSQVAERLGISRNSAYRHLTSLRKAGRIEYDAHRANSKGGAIWYRTEKRDA